MLDAERLRDVVRYDPDSGKFYWLDRDPSEFKTPQGYSVWRRKCMGKEAGYASGNGYLKFHFDGHTYFAHRLAWLYQFGQWPSQFIDHINGNGSDNRIANLRDVTPKENQRNTKRHKTNSSGVSGVRFDNRYGTWKAGIWDNSKRVVLGSFQTKSEAIAARKAAERTLGYHPNHGRAA